MRDIDVAVEALEAQAADDQTGQLNGLHEVARKLREMDMKVSVGEDGEPDSEEAAEREQFFAMCDAAADALDAAAVHDAEPSPWRQCVDALKPRLPRMELFRDEDRRLESRYDLNEVADTPPAALRHLADLADLDLRALRDEASADAIADVATRRNAANRVLLDAFDKSWNQQGIAIQIEVQGNLLIIQATTPEDQGLSNLTDRSDGLRWFAALLAFSHGWSEDTILLVDEIEQHLHYDAQADLVDVLTRQSFTSQVIYTTHSFGCLPHDLGTGVRMVTPIDAATSKLENGFWTKGAGFSPLLASMGAAAASFTPTRHALVGEGPSEAILLPTLLRQASGIEKLSFQVAPGLSIVAAAGVPALDAEAGRVAYLTDGDEGGQDLQKMLRRRGVTDSRMVDLVDDGEGLEIEDLVDESTYCQAVNDEIRCWQDPAHEFCPTDLTTALRTKALQRWCESHELETPDKVAVAQRVADSAVDHDAFAASRQELLISLLVQIHTALDLPEPEIKALAPSS